MSDAHRYPAGEVSDARRCGGGIADAQLRYPAGEVSDARRYQTRGEVSRGGGISRGRYQMHGGIPRGRYQTRGGEVSDARRYPAGEVSDARRGIRRAEVSDARS